MNTKKIHTNTLIIGSGLSGLIAALECAEKNPVTLISKSSLTQSNTTHAQGGIAAALSTTDSPEQHFEDTYKAGCYHGNPDSIKFVTQEGKNAIDYLIQKGLKFDTENSQLNLAQEGAHHTNRIVHVKDHTGKALTNTLLSQVQTHPNITVYENTFAYELITNNNHCCGCLTIHNNNSLAILANTTILATGGMGQLFSYTSNPSIATGDGLALAKQAGCDLIDCEFIQFHPTTFQTQSGQSFLLTEALRGAGAIITDNTHTPLAIHHPLQSLAPRDIIAKTIFDHLQTNNPVYLDCRSITDLPKQFPVIYQTLKENNIDPTKTPCPITPAAHYIMGGIQSNLQGETTIKHLYAIGEVAHTGLHGANRLASNSLLECIVFALQASKHSQARKPQAPYTGPIHHRSIEKNAEKLSFTDIQTLAWTHCGIIRNPNTIPQAKQRLNTLKNHAKKTCINHLEYRHLCSIAESICDAIQKRPNSLGAHQVELKEDSTTSTDTSDFSTNALKNT